jgi:hypothetical protein
MLDVGLEHRAIGQGQRHLTLAARGTTIKVRPEDQPGFPAQYQCARRQVGGDQRLAEAVLRQVARPPGVTGRASA